MQIKELNARLRQMAEDKRAVQKDRDRLERIVKSTAESSTRSSAPQVCSPGYCAVHASTMLKYSSSREHYRHIAISLVHAESLLPAGDF